MSRRKNASARTGCVSFPVEDFGIHKNTNLGGMYVQLVAVERRSENEEWWEDAWLDCFGGSNTTLDYQEAMVGTDTLVDGQVLYTEENEDTWEDEVSEVAHATKLIFPNFYAKVSKARRGQSVPLLASIVLGSSGGTWADSNGDPWRCSFEDLDTDGQALVENLKKLYGSKADLHLITWMDEG